MTVIAVDAMGGDNAPASEVRGVVAAIREGVAAEIILVGDQERLAAELESAGGGDLPIRLVHSTQVVSMSDPPGQVFRSKPDSSLRRAYDLVLDGEAEAVVSAGNSGAVLSHGLLLLKRIDWVDRPGIVAVFPSLAGTVVLCDMGANVEVKPTMLAQFGIIGAGYDRIVHGHTRPRVAILSNGSEASKGTPLTRAASELLASAASNPAAQFDYRGYVEASEIFTGAIDVVATDGFTGNIVLKLCEGLSEALFAMMQEKLEGAGRAPFGGLLARPAIHQLKQRLDYRETGGALLAGVNGVVMLCHGRSDERAIKNAIRSASEIVEGNVTAQLAAAIERHRNLWQSDESSGG